MAGINVNSSKPLYSQIKEQIKSKILSGEFKEGEKIPSEREFCEMFDVSRITVRQAIKDAINEDLLFTVHGKGTFVTKKKEQKFIQNLSEITSFEGTISSKGLSASSKIISKNISRLEDDYIYKILNFDNNDEIFNFNVLGMADSNPVVYYQSYFGIDFGQKIYAEALKKESEGMPFSTLDLYQEFQTLTPVYVEQCYEVVEADSILAEILKIAKNKPLFIVSSIVYDREDNPLEYKKAYYRADKYRFQIKRTIL